MFTSLEEIDESFDFDLICDTYKLYLDVCQEEGFVGFVINPSTDDFIVPKEFFMKFAFNASLKLENNMEGYGGDRLKELKDNMNNDKLIKYLKSDNDKELINQLLVSTLLTIVSSDEKFNGEIIEKEEIELFVNDEDYVLLFTNENELKNSVGNGNFYSQVAAFELMVDHIFYNDLNGFLIDNEYIISRKTLFEHLDTIGIMADPRFKKANMFSFQIK